jgi:hypothetical protein
MSPIAICQIALAASLGGMLFIFLRNLPLLPEFAPKPIPREKKLSFRLKNNLKKGKIKISEKFHQWGEKNAHRLRILVLKIDNSLTSYLKKARERKIHLEKIHFTRRKKIEETLPTEKGQKKNKEKIENKKNRTKRVKNKT